PAAKRPPGRSAEAAGRVRPPTTRADAPAARRAYGGRPAIEGPSGDAQGGVARAGPAARVEAPAGPWAPGRPAQSILGHAAGPPAAAGAPPLGPRPGPGATSP